VEVKEALSRLLKPVSASQQALGLSNLRLESRLERQIEQLGDDR
jgi:hypothetical protein